MRQKIPRGPTPPTLTVTPKQEAILQQIIRRSKSPQDLVLRARIVLAGRQRRQRNQSIGRELGCDHQTVARWRKRWLESQERLTMVEAEEEEAKLESVLVALLSDQPRSGAPAKFTAEQVCQIIALACEKPAESGRPISEWTPRELADEAVKRGIVTSISAIQVERFLKRGGVTTPSASLLAQQHTG